MRQGVLQSLIMAGITIEAQKMRERSRIIEQQATDLLAQTLRLDDTSARSYADRIATETNPQILLHYTLGNNEKGNPSHLASDFSRANAARKLVLASLNQPEMVSQANQLLRQSSMHPDSALITRAAMRAATQPFLDTEVSTRLDNDEVAFDPDNSPILFKLSLLFDNEFKSDTFYPRLGNVAIITQETDEVVISDNRDPIPHSIMVLPQGKLPSEEKMKQMAQAGTPHPTQPRTIQDRLFQLYFGAIREELPTTHEKKSGLHRYKMRFATIRALVRPESDDYLDSNFMNNPQAFARKTALETITPSGLAYWVALRASRAHTNDTRPTSIDKALKLIDQSMRRVLEAHSDLQGGTTSPLDRALHESQRSDEPWVYANNVTPRVYQEYGLDAAQYAAAIAARHSALRLLVRFNPNTGLTLRGPDTLTTLMKQIVFARLPQVDAGLFLHALMHDQTEIKSISELIPRGGYLAETFRSDADEWITLPPESMSQTRLAELGYIAQQTELFKHLQLRAETPRNASHSRDPRSQIRDDGEW